MAEPNPFDQFDAVQANPFDQFDAAASSPTPRGATRSWEEPPGLGSRVVSKLGEAWSDATNPEYSMSRKAVRSLGTLGEAAGDVVVEGAKGLFNLTTSPYTREDLKDLGSSLADTDFVKAQKATLGDMGRVWSTVPPETREDVEKAIQIPNLIPVYGATKLAIPGVRAGVNIAKNVAEDVISSKAGRWVTGIPGPDKALREVLQGKVYPLDNLTPRDITKGEKALGVIDTTGVKTNLDLNTKLRESIADHARLQDVELMKDPTAYSLDDLATVQKTKGGTAVKTNYVETALDNLEELYTKTNNPVKAGNIVELRAKAQDVGLTKKEVNDIARTYGSEYNAFNPTTGAPPTSVAKQGYENIRSGLKEVSRRGLDDTAKELDSTMSSLFNTERLITKRVEAVNRLQQLYDDRGIIDKATRFIVNTADVLTGGIVKGTVKALLPRSVGNKVMNAVDLEEKLARNLKIINKEIERVKNVKPIPQPTPPPPVLYPERGLGPNSSHRFYPPVVSETIPLPRNVSELNRLKKIRAEGEAYAQEGRRRGFADEVPETDQYGNVMGETIPPRPPRSVLEEALNAPDDVLATDAGLYYDKPMVDAGLRISAAEREAMHAEAQQVRAIAAKQGQSIPPELSDAQILERAKMGGQDYRLGKQPGEKTTFAPVPSTDVRSGALVGLPIPGPVAPVAGNPYIPATTIKPTKALARGVKVEPSPSEIVQQGATSGGKQVLIQEARQPKSADEFVKANTYYRGQDYPGGLGDFFTPDKKEAQKFATKVHEIQILPEDIYKSDIVPKATSSQIDNAIGEAKRKGFKAMFVDENKVTGSPQGKLSLYIFDKKGIKTKAQLTDLWNKSHEGKSPSPLPTAKATSGGKQPWEMTYDEVLKAVNPATKEELQRARPILKELYADRMENPEDPWGLIRAVDRGDELPRTPTVDLSLRHKKAIEQALSEGKPVPPEVLKDYPNLKSPSPLPTAKPGATSGGKQPWEMTRDELDVMYPKAGAIVDGRKVRSDVPNMGSIESSVDTPTILPGLYEIPLSEFEGGLTGKHYSASGTKRIAELADEISVNKEINPLIVVIGKDGPYILEGSTRAESLFKMGAKSFPAKVVLDEGSFYEAAKQAIKEGRPVPPEVLKDYPDLKPPSPLPTAEALPEAGAGGKTEKVVKPTKTEAQNVTTPKEQKAYVLETTDGLIAKARERWKAENEVGAKATLTDKEIDEQLLKGRFSSETPPIDAQTVTIDVPNDGKFKIPNTLGGLLKFQKNMKQMSTATAPSQGMKPTNVSNKPTGKSTDLITEEAQAEVDTIKRMPEEAKASYLYFKDTALPQAEANYTKWSALGDEVDSGKRTLKSLTPEFGGRVPSSKDLYAKVREARESISKQDKYLRDSKETIQRKYPSLAKEMFPETAGPKSINDLLRRK